MAKNQLRIQLEAPSGDVRLEDFSGQLHELRLMLVETARSIDPDAEAPRFVVVDLSHSSPATIVLEPAQANAEMAMAAFGSMVGNFIAVGEGTDTGLNQRLLESYSGGTARLGGGLRSIALEHAGRRAVVSPEVKATLSRMLGDGFAEHGSIRGVLQAVNVHSQPAHFHLYPAVGPTRIRCEFDRELLEEVRRGLEHSVQVSGELRFRPGAWHPHTVLVSTLEVLPGDEDLPSLRDLRGSAPDLTGGEAPEVFVRKLRDEWN